MSRKAAAGGETILEKFAEQVLVLRERDHAVAYVTRRKNAILASQAAGAAAVVRHGDHRREIGDGPADFFLFCRGDIFFQAAEDGGESGAASQSDNANGTRALLRGIFHGNRGKLAVGTVSLRVEKFGEARILLQERKILVVARVVAIFGAQLNGDFQILHGGFRFAGEAIERGHGVNNVVGFRSGFARAVEMLAGFVPAAEIHQRDALGVMILRGFQGLHGESRNALVANADVDLRAVAQFPAGAFEHALEGLLGARKFLLLKVLEGFLVEFELCLLGGRVGIRGHDRLGLGGCL